MPKPPNEPPWPEQIRRRQLGERLRDAAARRLQARRSGKRVVQFEQITDTDGRSVPVNADHLLLRSADLSPERADTLASLGLTTEPVDGLDGRVLRVLLPAGRTRTLEQTHAELRKRGVPVSPCAITPMGAPTPTVVWKSLCTPEPVASPFLAAPETPTAPPRVAVIDTGVTDQQRTDGWLVGLAHAGGDNVDPLDVFPSPNGYLDLGAGHGTFVAGIVQRFAPSVRLEVWRALDSDGLTDETVVAAVMVAAAQDGADVLNLSLGAETYDGSEPLALAEAMRMIGEIAQRDGREIVVVAAAGNSGTEDPVYPAAFPDVVAVAGLTPAGTPAAWSSRGVWVDCSAVGENVVSTYVQGTEDVFVPDGDPPPVEPPVEYPPDSWAVWLGTSFAAPQVTARIARTAQEQNVGVRAAATQVLGSGTPVGGGFGVRVA